MDDDRLRGKLSANDDDTEPAGGDSPPDLTDHAAGAGPETKPGQAGVGGEDHTDADPRDPESAGNENLRSPGGRSEGS